MRARLLSWLSRYLLTIVLAIYVLTLIVLHALHRFPAPGNHDIARLIGQPSVAIEGTVIDFPSTRWNQTRFVLQGRDQSFHGRTLVTLSFPEYNLAPGEQVRVHGWLSAPKAASPRHPFDEEGYWAGQDVYSLLRVWTPSRFERLRAPPWWCVRYEAWRFRRSFEEFWAERLPWEEAGLLLGMTLGSRGTLAPTLKDACQRAGVYHIVVVSGQAVSWVIGFGLLLLRALRVPARHALWICGLPIVFYVCIVGAEPPAVRASAMALIGLSVLVMGRDTLRFQPLLLAAGGILVVEPEALFGASFQLSFGATAAIVAIAHRFQSFHIPRRGWRRVVQWILDMTALSTAVTIGVGPLLVYYFHRFSVVGIFANWTVFPCAGVIMVSGLFLWDSGNFLSRLCATELGGASGAGAARPDRSDPVFGQRPLVGRRDLAAHATFSHHVLWSAFCYPLGIPRTAN